MVRGGRQGSPGDGCGEVGDPLSTSPLTSIGTSVLFHLTLEVATGCALDDRVTGLFGVLKGLRVSARLEGGREVDGMVNAEGGGGRSRLGAGGGEGNGKRR